MSYTASGYIQCLADLVKLFNWRQVVVLYEDDDYGSTSASVIPLLNVALLSVGSDISGRVAFPPQDSLSKPKGLVRRELEKLKPRLCKVFIIVRWSSPSLATELFKEAGALGLMTKGHVWIAGYDITTLLDLTFTPSSLSSYMQGVIGIKTYLHVSRKPYHDFSAKFQKRFQAEYGKKGETNFKPGMYALQAYDAVHVIAHANAVARETLLEGIRSTNFVGLSGRVRFRRDGTLMEGKSSSSFQIINIVGKGYREMGIWLKGRGFYRDEREMGRGAPAPAVNVNLFGTIYWPGGAAEKVPGGWGKLRVGVPARTTFNKFVKVEYDSEQKVKDVTGFCIEVYKKARELLSCELPYEFFPFNGTYDELVASVPEKFDAVVCDVTILTQRLGNATFTVPFLPSELTRVVRVAPNSKQWVLTKPFSRGVWLVMVATYIYTCITVWYLERKQNPEFHGPWRKQLGATLWLIFCTIFVAHGKIHSYYTKAVIAVWLFVLLILTSTFTASLGSILITENLVPVVSDQKIGCNGASFAGKYLEEILGYKEQQFEKIRSVENYNIAFQSGHITMAYLETPYMKLFLSQYGSDFEYTAYGDTQRLGGFGFAFPKNSPLAEDFSKAILQLSENGMLSYLEDKWFSQSLVSCPDKCKSKIRENLDLGSLWMLFLLTGAASTIVLAVFKARFVPSNSRRCLAVASGPLVQRCEGLGCYKCGTGSGH